LPQNSIEFWASFPQFFKQLFPMLSSSTFIGEVGNRFCELLIGRNSVTSLAFTIVNNALEAGLIFKDKESGNNAKIIIRRTAEISALSRDTLNQITKKCKQHLSIP
jgi:hypothetical protein